MRRPTGGALRVGAAWVGSDGAALASARLQALLEHCAPSALAICGMCAGHGKSVALGDVIVADRIYRYDPDVPDEGRPREAWSIRAGWAMEARYFARRFDERGVWMARRPPTLEMQYQWLLRALYAHEHDGGPAPAAHPDRKRRCPDWADVIRGLEQRGQLAVNAGTLTLTEEGRAVVAEQKLLYLDGPPRELPVGVQFGAVATVASFKGAPDIFDRLRAVERRTIGLDMEAAALCEVAERLSLPVIFAKAVADFADGSKEDRFHRFAARVSAEFVLGFLLEAPLPGLEQLAARSSPQTLSQAPGSSSTNGNVKYSPRSPPVRSARRPAPWPGWLRWTR